MMKNLRVIKFLFLFLFAPTAFGKDCVVLLHGLARTSNSMNPIEQSLEDEGYKVFNLDYPSTKYEIAVLSEVYVNKGVRLCKNYDQMHFVTHSMGGILVRYYMKHFVRPHNLGHVVMLAPPHRGSELVNALQNVIGYDWWNGPSGSQLGVEDTSLPNTLGPVDFSLGVIAGNRETSILSHFFDEPNDGKVSVKSTKVEGMTDHTVIYSSHTFIMRRKDTKRLVSHYLKNGSF